MGYMLRWNLHKDRWDHNRESQFEYYRKNDYSIFSTYKWDDFLKRYVYIYGIDSAKQQTEKFVDELIKNYVSYAKLAVFFK